MQKSKQMLFKDIIVSRDTKAKLVGQIKNQRVSHAQLIHAAGGTGGLALAIAYAQMVMCHDKQEEDSCGKCKSCVKFENYTHPDLLFVYPNSTTKDVTKNPSSSKLFSEWVEVLKDNPYLELNDWIEHLATENKQLTIGVLDSQELVKKLSLKAFESEYKVVIIWLPEKMNLSAANKLLKVLEEPSEKTVFLLVSEDPDQLLPTIISRVQLIRLPKLGGDPLALELSLKYRMMRDELDGIAYLSEGNVNKALSLIRGDEAEDFYMEKFQNWMRLCYAANVVELIKWVDEIAKIGRERQKNLVEYALRMFRECIAFNYSTVDLNSLHEREQAFVNKFAPFIHGGNMVIIAEKFENLHKHIGRNANPKIAFHEISLILSKLLKVKPLA